VAKKNGKSDVDAEADFHGLTAEQLRQTLSRRWPEWRGMHRVRIIHGRGEVLRPELERWCEERGIPFAPDPGNPGSMRLFPSRRTLPDNTLRTTLREKGLRLTPDQEAALRDPQAAERARQEALRQQQAAERRRRAEETAQAAQKRRDEALWQAEVARLNALDRRNGGAKKADDREKPGAPVILPPVELKFQTGYWRAELVRVAETDTETLTQQKRTGLDKLAPPLEAAPAPQQPDATARPPRDTAEDDALFAAEMNRLAALEPDAVHRSRRG